jgi:hypothetical protein
MARNACSPAKKATTLLVMNAEHVLQLAGGVEVSHAAMFTHAVSLLPRKMARRSVQERRMGKSASSPATQDTQRKATKIASACTIMVHPSD